MYAGITLRNGSGNIVGAHQKIDKVARRHLSQRIPENISFPTARQIIHFEGRNGPDGIKSKSPGRDEPWHFVDPTDHSDTQLIDMIEQHLANLVAALADDEVERASFEAAWMAHAIVDGLTPAHHYPLEEKLEQLRGEGLETRTGVRGKIIIPGISRRAAIRNNWEFWGAKGVMTTHILFEIGIAAAIAPLKLDNAAPNGNDYIRIENEGFEPLYKEAIAQVYGMKLYDEFHKRGWTRSIARRVKQELTPLIIRVVCLAWYDASLRAAKRKERRGRS